MSTWTHEQASELFLQLRSLTKDQAHARVAAVQDAALREEVQSLLEFDAPPTELGSPRSTDEQTSTPLDNTLPRAIGPYTILSRLGQGGSGVVLLAQQDEPVRRRVAVKIVPYAAISPDLASRFEFERRALERMDHHNIARILDTGRTSEGLPYLVMEYVEGEPITSYCTTHRLSLTHTLNLFLQVCEGVQHAHQRGIIHRDLKPANILITQTSGNATARVLDFGISKPTPGAAVTNAPPTSALAIGTPGYMAPEQTGGQAVDTRADVYALGSILYELISGRPPIEPASDPVQHILKLRDHIPSPASRTRRSQPNTHNTRRERAMLADLDRILAVALEKDPARRFQTVDALADDLRRTLAQRPIEARPPSLSYRATRFAQRNAVLVASLITVSLALLLGIAGLVGGLLEARRQRAQAIDQTMALAEINRFLNDDLLAPASPQRDGEKVTVSALLDRASDRIDQRLADRPMIAAALHHTVGNVYMELGEFQKAQQHLQQSSALCHEHAGPDNPDTLRADTALAALLVRMEKYDQGAAALKDLLPRARLLLGAQDALVYTICNELGVAAIATDHPKDAIALLQESLAGRQRLLGQTHPTVLSTMSNLAQAFDRSGDTQASLDMDLKALALAESLPSPDRYSLIGLNNNIGATWQDLNQDAKAAPYIRRAVDLAREYLGPDNPDTLIIQANLASLEAELGNPAKGIELLDAVIKARTRLTGPQSHETLTARYSYWNCVWIAKRYDDAAEGFKSLFADSSTSLGPDHWFTAQVQAHYARALADAGKRNEALPIAVAAADALRKLYGEQHPRTVNAIALVKRLETPTP